MFLEFLVKFHLFTMETIMTLVPMLTMEANTGATQIFQTKVGKIVTNPLALYKTVGENDSTHI